MGSDNFEFSLVPPHRVGRTYEEYLAAKPPYSKSIAAGAGQTAAEATGAAPEVIVPEVTATPEVSQS